LPVVIFGRRRGSGRALQQQKLAPDAQQLWIAQRDWDPMGMGMRAIVSRDMVLENVIGCGQLRVRSG
jgi:hypothetical protein